MSLSISLSNAITGLTGAARGAEAVSSNVSNAMTEGYGVRRLQLASRAGGHYGAGVQVLGVERMVDMQVIGDRRLADAGLALADTRLGFQTQVETMIGLPGEAGSLADRMAQFEASLITASARPDVDSRLSASVTSAKQLASKFNDISDGLQDLRQQADRAISADVATLNSTLHQLQEIGSEITRRITSGQDYSAQLDQRQILVDRVSEIVPVKEVDRGRGQIALITPGGGLLLDGKAATFEFSQVGIITPDMSRESGSLSGLTMNGIEVSLDNTINAISGGRLAGHFEVRDGLAVKEQARVDALARDLVERFQDPALDPTLALADPGLFTDGGDPFVAIAPVNEEGLSARLSINALVDPEAGGEVRRMRDGLNAAAVGEVGNASVLLAMSDAMSAPRAITGSGFSGTLRSAGDLASEFLSLAGMDRHNFEVEYTFTSSSQASLKEIELRDGVDTDHEMQQLLLIEAAYQANARVISTVDDLLAQLLEI